jgi:hypothetical protein
MGDHAGRHIPSTTVKSVMGGTPGALGVEKINFGRTAMKTWFGFLLIVGTLMVGCASGDYARQSASGERPPAFQDSGMYYQNPETDAQQANRIWSMESHP